MKRPVAFAAPIVIVMILLIIPLGQLALGGISEKYLPPDNSVRQAQEEFDKIFPGFRTEPLTLVIESDNGQPVTDQQIAEVRNKAMQISGFIDAEQRPVQDVAGTLLPRRRVEGSVGAGDPERPGEPQRRRRRRSRSCARCRRRAASPLSVGGTPALEQDSIHSLFDKLPLMVVLLIITTTILMFLAFGSVVLPIKAAVMSALTLGSTMGMLTWMFVDGHGSGLMNYTPQPLMAPMIGLIIAVIWGLSTDYEVFLVSRMVEARERGMSTAEAIRIGTATTGRLITGAALVLAVVAGAFVFSDLVMMKYLAFGLLIALLLDATVDPDVPGARDHEAARRRLLVGAAVDEAHPGTPRARRDRAARRAQAARGPRARRTALVGAGAPLPPRPRPPHDPTHPAVEGSSRPGARRRGSDRRRAPTRAVGRGHHPHPDRSARAARRRAADHPDLDAANRNAVRNAGRATRHAAPQRTEPPRHRRRRRARTARSSRGWASCAATAAAAAARRPSATPPAGAEHRPQQDATRQPAIRCRRRDAARPAHQDAERRRRFPRSGSRIRKRPRSSTRAEDEDERQAPRRRAASAPLTCCAAKAGVRRLVGIVDAVTDVVGVGLDDRAALGLLSLASSASGSLASSTRIALLRNADGRHGQQRSDDARQHRARRRSPARPPADGSTPRGPSPAAAARGPPAAARR